MTVNGKSVLVVGVGGLGCPASLALAKGGIARLTLVDADRVEPSNLPRQLWHRTSDLGRLKVRSAAARLRAAFPGLEVAERAERLEPEEADALFAAHDLVIDATDGAEQKFGFSDASVRTGVPLVHGGVIGLRGRVMLIRPGGPCLRCLFEPTLEDRPPNCARAGVLGTVAGIIGALQATRALAYLRNEGGYASGRSDVERLIRFEGNPPAPRALEVRRRADCPACAARTAPPWAATEASWAS